MTPDISASGRSLREPCSSRATRFVVTLILPVLVQSASAAQSVMSVRGQVCTAQAPEGWAFTGENAAGAAFGADLAGPGGRMGASYFLVGIAPEMIHSAVYGPAYATADQAALTTLSGFGTRPIRCAAPSDVGQGLRAMRCRTPEHEGLAVYQTFPMAGGGYVLVMRTAGVPVGRWRADGKIAAAAARSIRCNVPLRPSTADFTTGLSSSSPRRRAAEEGDSEYSPWLGMEHYHDPQTGENYWVSPSTDYQAAGPRGPGYYVGAGNELRKLEPGRSD